MHAVTFRSGAPAEALALLRAAAPAFPRAHLLAARLLAGQGQSVQAAAELRRYLAWGKAENRDALQSWLASLER